MVSTIATPREELRPERVLTDWMDKNNARLTGSTPAMLVSVLAAAGYRKGNVLGYIVVDRGGVIVGNQHKHKESAQTFADEWTADCKTAGIDWEYRVAEIVEAQA